LLFGEGLKIDPNVLTDKSLLKKLLINKMVDRRMLARGLPGYGLEGYGLEGEGFRYPSVKTYLTKKGISPEYFQKWAEAYAKNKLTAASKTLCNS
jgi:hypothetical protein